MTNIWTIYKATGKCGRGYVGVTTRGHKLRWSQHVKEANAGSPLAIHCAIRKHGPEWFLVEVLCECYSAREAKACERAAIASHNTYCHNGFGFNLTIGGDGVWGIKFSEASRAKMSASLKKWHAENPGHIQKMVDVYNAMGRPRSDEGRAAILAAARKPGEWSPSPDARKKISATLKGKKQSPERAAQSRASLERIRPLVDQERRNAKLSATHKKIWNDPIKKAERKALMSSPAVYANKCEAMRKVAKNLSPARRKQMGETVTKINQDSGVKRLQRILREYEKALARRIGHDRPYRFRSDRGSKKPINAETSDKISRTKRVDRLRKEALRARGEPFRRQLSLLPRAS